jgi:hypothetical protein
MFWHVDKSHRRGKLEGQDLNGAFEKWIDNGFRAKSFVGLPV